MAIDNSLGAQEYRRLSSASLHHKGHGVTPEESCSRSCQTRCCNLNQRHSIPLIGTIGGPALSLRHRVAPPLTDLGKTYLGS